MAEKFAKPTCPQCGGTVFTDVIVKEINKRLQCCSKCGRTLNPCDLVGARFKVMQNILKKATAA